MKTKLRKKHWIESMKDLQAPAIPMPMHSFCSILNQMHYGMNSQKH
jgi:hypothetical protein